MAVGKLTENGCCQLDEEQTSSREATINAPAEAQHLPNPS